ncbi:MAG: FAD-dependent oxidoreductase [Actinomycetota bacterium]
MNPVVVVGAGIAGVACARELAAAGLPVRVLDRGRRVGGRMAVRTVDGHAVDTGASYFTVSEPAFASVVEDWRERGLAREWTDTFHLAGPDGLEGTKAGPVRWAATQGLRSLVVDLARGLDVVSDHVVERVAPGLVDGEPASAVVLAMPDPQAARLTEVTDPVTDYTPALVLAAGFARRTWPRLDASFVHDDPSITFVADDGARRGDDAAVLVAHSTADLARAHLAEPAGATDAMLAALARVTGVTDLADQATWSFVHRWTFAQPASTREQPWHLGEDLVGRCGDGWSTRPRVEAAFESGRLLGAELVARLGAAAPG